MSKTTKDEQTLQRTIQNRFHTFFSNHPNTWNINTLVSSTGLNYQKIYRTINGTHVTPENLRAISIATGVSTDYFLGLSGKETTLDITTYQGVFYYLRYMIENDMIGYDFIRKEIGLCVKGQPESFLRASTKLRMTFWEDMKYYDYGNNLDYIQKDFEDLYDIWKQKRRNLFTIFMNEKEDYNDWKRAFGTYLENQLNIKNWTAKKLDEQITFNENGNNLPSLSKGLISHYISGKVTPPIERICALAKLFKTTTDHLLGTDWNDLNNPPKPGDLFDAIFFMKEHLILISTDEFVSKDELETIYVRDPIAKRFCKRYYTLYQNLKLNNNLDARQELFHKIADKFTMSIPLYKKFWSEDIPLGEADDNLDECYRWLSKLHK
jgi:transcriptional regulator with XRE-family HTH domain